MKNAAIYVFSRTNDEKSISGQIKTIKNYCEEYDCKIIKQYVDIKDSSKEYFRMMMELDEFDVLLVYRYDIITSKCESVFKLEEDLKKHNVEFVSVMDSEYKLKAERAANSVFSEATDFLKKEMKSHPIQNAHRGKEPT